MNSKYIIGLIVVALVALMRTSPARAEEEISEIIVLNDKDLSRGYVVHWGGPKFPFTSARPVELVLGTDEKESLELGVLALRDLGKVTLSVGSMPQLPEGSVLLRTMQGISTSMGFKSFNWGRLTMGRKGIDTLMEWKDYALLEGSELRMPNGAHKSFWLTLDGRKIPPGKYALKLLVEPEGTEPREVGLTVQTVDVRRQGEDDLQMFMYHNDAWLAYQHPKIFKKHLQLMRECGQRQFRINPDRHHHNSVKFWRDEKGEIQADYFGIDRLLKPARELGFDIFGWPTSAVGKGLVEDWLSDELKKLPMEELEPLADELTRRFFQHILDLGYKEIWWYCIDEPTVERATDPKFVERLKSYNERFPMLRPHCALNHYRPRMVNLLNPYMDIWMVDQAILVQMKKDIAKGLIKIDQTDVLGCYGSGYYHHSPDAGVRNGAWLAAWQKSKYYAYFAYGSRYSEQSPYVCFATADGKPGSMPFSTPGLEGVREGYEDLAYWHTLDVLLERLAKKKHSREQQKQIAAAHAFRESLVADTSEESLIPWTMGPANEGRGYESQRSMQKKDRWLLRKVKGDLLRQIASIQKLLDQ